ncbi:TPA: hypothetical protein UMF67_001990 [Stenotrophomonas maltophilia]|uniref:DUF6624 domain-containing protein n=1 Tax=Stenotrophomonas maltophilia TaxID=40324 RepID=UPI001F52E995|nr:DUF6624 domain-containing protein [Stenotrophomonas maltophilia]MBN4991807.1 hypothetical protein [Stenotrophomonas maltophilia]MCI1150342.1 hypothetical protein [Stenotrophomonas maltophilia]HEL3158263.1 hypothetical protein [Stenotrophomonas maltophilia]
MSHTSMQWLRASATTVALALALGTPLDAHAAAEDPFFTALDRYGADDFSGCARLLGELLQRGGRFPDGGELLLVECTAAAGDRSQAMDYVNQLLPRGRLSFDDLLHKDRPGLNALRADPAWPDMQRRVEAAEQQRLAQLDAPLRKELLERAARDQAAQHVAIDAGGGNAFKGVASVAQANADWLKTMIADKGWPTYSRVGHDGAKAAWLIVQHADHDPAFQAQVLPLIEHAAKAGEADLPDLALLTDRVLLAQGKPQRYGSQFTTAGDGTMELRPTEDMDGLDARRQAMGLQPLAQYKATLSEAYRKPVR